MAVFSTQQVRHFYVVKGKETPEVLRGFAAAADYPNAANVGKTALILVPDYDHSAAHPTDGRNMAEGFQFMTVTSTGDIITSDRIWRQSIRSIKLTKAADLRMKLPTVEIKFNNFTFNGQTLAAGDGNVYFLNFRFPAFLNSGEEEVMTRTITFQWETGNWADACAKAINQAFIPRHNLHNKLVVATAMNATTVEIYAPEGTWNLGLHSNKPNRFTVENPEVEIYSDPTLTTEPASANYRVKECGKATDKTATTTHTVGNGKITADLEWFCMGERGDTFRGAGWPNTVKTDYQVDHNKEYDYLDIHYYFQGEGFVDDKSEKQMTLVAESGSEDLQYFYDLICGNTNPSPTPDPTPTPTPEPGGDVHEGDIYSFTSYGDAEGTTRYGEGKVTVGPVGDTYAKVVVTENYDESFVGNEYFIRKDAVADGETLNELFTDDQGTSANIWVSVVKED